MKVLITGATGQLGSDAVYLLRNTCQVTARSSLQLDIADRSAVEEVLRRVAPDVILNCAAFTKVDACETEKSHAWNVNVEGPKNLAWCVNSYGGSLIHISTDYVFDGTKKPPGAYHEDDETCPVSCYGQTKLEGEEAIRNTTDRFVIVRTAWVYGINGHNFLKTILRLALQDPAREIKVVNDQFGSPTWSYRLAQQVAELIKITARGLYHATSEGYCTWYELAKYFLDKMEIRHPITPCATREYPTPAARPKNSILENRRLNRQGINIMRSWQDDVTEFVNAYRQLLLVEARKGAE